MFITRRCNKFLKSCRGSKHKHARRSSRHGQLLPFHSQCLPEALRRTPHMACLLLGSGQADGSLSRRPSASKALSDLHSPPLLLVCLFPPHASHLWPCTIVFSSFPGPVLKF